MVRTRIPIRLTLSSFKQSPVFQRASPHWGCVCVCVCVCISCSVVSAFVTPWTVAHQAPLSMGFSGKNTGVGCHSFLQGIFLTQGSNPGLLPYRQILSHKSHQRLHWGFVSILRRRSKTRFFFGGT